jgi:hypothetical protein
MEIKIPIKIHNKFKIEVKDVATGEITKKGYAENIVLNSAMDNAAIFSSLSSGYPGSAIAFGRGTGVLSAERTTLFDQIGYKGVTRVEYIFNHAPLPSYATRKIVIEPSEYVGETITEVGLSKNDTSTIIYTHALIKDSEGNPLALGPKTALQQITIYATVYAQPNFEEGINFASSSGLPKALLMDSSTLLDFTTGPDLFINGSNIGVSSNYSNRGHGLIQTNIAKLLTTQANTKIKSIAHKDGGAGDVFTADLLTLAENGSQMWGGYEFNQTPVGVGDGITQAFNLAWDEVWEEKPKSVYIDGVEVTTGITWATDSITFETAPSDQAIITADYWVKYIPKDSDHELWLQFQVNYGEGSVS